MKTLILFILFVPSMAMASGMAFNPSISTYRNDNDTVKATGISGRSETQIELRLGYQFDLTEDIGLFAGGFYSLGSDKFLDHTNQWYLGPMVGVSFKGLYLLGSYILTGENDLASGGLKYSGTTGYQGTIGYRAEISEGVFIGPEFTFRTVEFDNREVQGIVNPGDRSDTHVLPSIAVYFKF